VNFADVSPIFGAKRTGTIETETLSVALIGPDKKRRSVMRKALADTRRANVREFDSYPPEVDYMKRLAASFDVIVLDADSDANAALGLMEKVNAGEMAKFIVYSERSDPKLAVRALRAGAREFVQFPLAQGVIEEVLARIAATLQQRAVPPEKTLGKLLIFVGSKGGSGVTTVACNVAIALAQNSDQRVLLIDLALPIGDAALCLGIAADYSTQDALRNIDRLDARYLQNLLVKHQSGVSVLAAPTEVPEGEVSKVAVDRLISVARHEFDHVIVDVGSRIDVAAKVLLEDASTIYLVTQTGISDLRNSNRMISQFFAGGNSNIEIVLNRAESRSNGTANEDVITKALGRPVRWKIPDDQDAARALQHGDAGPTNTRISRISLEMAGSITGRAVPEEKKKPEPKVAAKNGARPDNGHHGPTNIPNLASLNSVIKWPTPNAITYGEGLTPTQLNATASIDGTFAYTPGPGYVLPVGTHTLWVTFTPAGSGRTPLQAAVSIHVVKATPAIDWPTPDEIPGGTALDETQLNASSPVPGVFEYSPAAGAVLPRGSHTLSVTFTPDDGENYTTAEAEVTLSVAKITSPIEWPRPEAITYGIPLSDAQLCASSSVAGKFDYAPGAGSVLAAGAHKLSVHFTPDDIQEYSTSQASVPLTVAQAIPSIEWPIPAPIAQGTALSAAQLNAKVMVPGSLAYRPALGETLSPGVHNLSVSFTPADPLNYTSAKASVSLTVNEKQASQITWPVPSAISYGTALSDAQLNATASGPGTFVYTPSVGHVLAPGRYTLTVTFTPEDTERFAAAQATVELEVEGSVEAEPTPYASQESPSDAYAAPSEAAEASHEGAEAPAEWSFLAPGTASAEMPQPETLHASEGSHNGASSPAADPMSEWSFLEPGAATANSAPFQANGARSSSNGSKPDEAGETEFKWTFTTTVPGAADLTPAGVEGTPEANGSHDMAVSSNAVADASSEWNIIDADSASAHPGSADTSGEHTAATTNSHEIRTYKGAVYEKGDDGKWHLQKN